MSVRPHPELFICVLSHEHLLIKILQCDEVEKGAHLSLQINDEEEARRKRLKSRWIPLTSQRHDIHQQLRLKLKKIAASLSIVIQKSSVGPPASHCLSVVSFLKDDKQFEYRKTFTDSLDLFFCQIPFSDCRSYYDNTKSLTVLLKLDSSKTELQFAKDVANVDDGNEVVWDLPCIKRAISDRFPMKNKSKIMPAGKPFIVSSTKEKNSNGSAIVDWVKEAAIRESSRIAWKIFYGLVIAILAYLLPTSFVTELKKLIGLSA